MYISDEDILNCLNSLNEHKMAKEIFIPMLKKMGMLGVNFTGGQDEVGIDIEYYELTQPEKHKSYVGIQFKKGDIVYGTGGNKNTVITLKNQADEAFNKEIPSVNSATKYFIERYIVATTGHINGKAKEMINKARLKGQDRRIKYWDGDQLIEYIRDYWLKEFITYFQINTPSKKVHINSTTVVDSEYIEENYSKTVKEVKKVKKILTSTEFEFLATIAYLCALNDSRSASESTLFLELGHQEDYYRDEVEKLHRYGFIQYDEGGYFIDGEADCVHKLYIGIFSELMDADEDEDEAQKIFTDIGF